MASPYMGYVCYNCRISQAFNRPLRRPLSSSSRRAQVIRPASAPKPTPNIRHIRENAELYARNCIDRNYASHRESSFRIQDLFEETRRLDQDLKTPRARIKELEKTIAQQVARATIPLSGKDEQSSSRSGKDGDLAALRSEAQRLKDESQAMISRKSAIAEEMQQLALALPNLSSAETPIGDEPRLIDYINFDPQNPPEWATNTPNATRSHVYIGSKLGLIDFSSSATTTGWGWYFLTNEGALLEQALAQYALTVARRRGWKPVSPPSIVYSYISEACGFQPRDQNNEQQIWAIEQSDKDRSKPARSLAGTAEIPLAAMYAGRDLDAADLPIKLVGSSRCYRAEAGSRGVDTKGLYRVHEFTKVELFAWADNPLAADPGFPFSASDATKPPAGVTSATLFSELLDIQREIFTSLNLPCRILEMPTSDLGASASRKWDIEALFPSRLRMRMSSSNSFATLDLETAWGEVTSASICTDYQTRRLGTRVRGGAAGVKESRFPHTVNGTAMAVPRVLACILENGWDEKRGVVVIPQALREFMGGMEVIGNGPAKPSS